MSLCYDFEMWNIITLSAILTVCLVGMISMVYGQESEIPINGVYKYGSFPEENNVII